MGLARELNLPKPIERPDHEALLSLVLTAQMLTKEGDRLLRPFGLTDSQFNVLVLLYYQAGPEGFNQSDLGRMLVVNRSNITGLVARMEQAGWVVRSGRAGDRRIKMVRLTPAGRRLTERVAKLYFQQVARVMGGLGAGDLKTLGDLLARIRARLRA